jgi:hypothetical protein
MPKFLSGYKSYAIAAIAVAIGIDQALIQYGYHVPAVPEWLLIVLAGTGLYSVRNGVTTDTQKAVSTVLAQITTTQATTENKQPSPSSPIP